MRSTMSKVEDPPFQGLQDGRESKASNHPTQGQKHFAGQPLVGRFGAAGRGVGGRERGEAALITSSLSPGLEGINIKDRVSLLPRNMPYFIGVFQTTSEHSLADH